MTQQVRQRPPQVEAEQAVRDLLEGVETLLGRVGAVENEQANLVGAVASLAAAIGHILGRLRALEAEVWAWEADELEGQPAISQVATD